MVETTTKERTTRTKIIGALIVAVAVIQVAVDALDGGGFNLGGHIDSIMVALGGAGLYTLRDAVKKVENVINKK